MVYDVGKEASGLRVWTRQCDFKCLFLLRIFCAHLWQSLVSEMYAFYKKQYGI
jgi:hypothetical protein